MGIHCFQVAILYCFNICEALLPPLELELKWLEVEDVPASQHSQPGDDKEVYLIVSS